MKAEGEAGEEMQKEKKNELANKAYTNRQAAARKAAAAQKEKRKLRHQRIKLNGIRFSPR